MGEIVSYLSAADIASDQKVIPLQPLSADDLVAWQREQAPSRKEWIEASGFQAKPGQVCALPSEGGGIKAWLFGTQPEGWLTQLAAVFEKLPQGQYRLDCDWSRDERLQAALGWGLAAYRFDRYKEIKGNNPVLVLDEDVDRDARSLLAAQSLVRDLVNTPTEDMGPRQLADAASELAREFGADYSVIEGDELLTENYPAVHAVGRASTRPPRLIELAWGDADDPLLAIVGKGVCFDTGGLNLKPAGGMILMKKDMGGAAHVLALARLVMDYELPVRLLMLIPAVENSVSGNAYRPGDVIPTRKGLSVEIGNTDAEGRVILSDALTYASEQEPDLVIDFATLTGAARIAMGPDLPPLFSNRDEISSCIQQAGLYVEAPLWTLPLHQPYNKMIESPIADLNNVDMSPFGGCITAALFLEHFVDRDDAWVHIDTFAWNQANQPGRPLGGEALGMRAVFRYLQQRYA
mgnify:FL=1